MEAKKIFAGELALFIALIINSLGLCLMVKSGFGITAISSVPYILSVVFPGITFGTWNYLFQTLLVLTLMIIRKKYTLTYALPFVIGLVFGEFVNLFDLLMPLLSDGFIMRIGYFIISSLFIAIGISLMINCKLPIIPTDIFPKDLAIHFNWSYKTVKTSFDLACLTVTVLLSWLNLYHIIGVGVGTAICALTMGKTISVFSSIWLKKYTFKPMFVKFESL